MVVLALDTSVRTGSVAVLRGRDPLIERVLADEIPHGRRLPAVLLDALDAAHVALADVELYAVAAGPGAFTGLRIGIATVQGLAFAHGRPVAGVSALDALASAVPHSVTPGSEIAVWMDAARGEVFSALYAVEGPGSVRVIDPPAVDRPEAILRRWHEPGTARRVYIGEGSVRYADLVIPASGGQAAIVDPTPPIAAQVGRLALLAAAAGAAGPPHAVRPLYVRRPDAELARERRAEERTGRG